MQILSGSKTNIVVTKTYKYCHANIVCNKTLCGPCKFLSGPNKYSLDQNIQIMSCEYCWEQNLVWNMQILSGRNKYCQDQNIQILSGTKPSNIVWTKHTNMVWTKTYKYCHVNIVWNKTLCGPNSCKFCQDRTNIVWTIMYNGLGI